jgi:WS/DGAT/MGAT family acyltransferase
VPGGYTFQKVKDTLAARLHLLPPFRRRLVTVPLNLHHPVWIEDPDFNLDDHVRRVGAPAPGGRREFGELISEIASHQLDRSRPLWELWVVEGLEDGHIGFVTKIHHSAADGVASAALLANVFDLEPEILDAPPPAQPWVPDHVPTATQLVLQALAAIVRQLLALPALLASTTRGLRAVIARRRQPDAVSPPLPFATPKTSFNAALTPRRIFAFTSLSLADMKAAGKAVGGTVNDVVLAVCAGALRRYLADRNELPDRPLVAGVPTSTQSDAEAGRLSGNKVSNMFTSVPVHLADPVERVRHVHEITKGAKEVHNALGAEMLEAWSELTPPVPFAAFMRLYSRSRLADRHRPPINLVISNVPGPQQPLYIAGARLDALYSVGPILEGIGLNITVWSYLGQMNFGLVACRDTMPDLWHLADGLHDSLEELTKAVAA